MKPSIVLLCIGVLILVCLVNTKTILPNEDDDGNKGDIKEIHVDENEVIFYYLSRNTPLTKMRVTTVDDIAKTDFNPLRRTMFIIFGWLNDRHGDINTKISAALLKADDWNVLIVDWSKYAKKNYKISVGSIPGVGNITAKFIKLLQVKTGIQMSNINLCGHSLGAHVSGHVGSVFNGEVNSIVGMDPALPSIDIYDNSKHLDSSDGKYVQVIHTTGGTIGFLTPIGHSDFYPNGGKKQKGCGPVATGTCGHARSFLYFAESITNNNFKARLCKSDKDWKKGKCNNNQVAYMGGNHLDRVYGTFYLDTAKNEPFALG